METKRITVSLGLSLPITILCGYLSFNAGRVAGKLEAYKEVVNKEKKDSEKI